MESRTNSPCDEKDALNLAFARAFEASKATGPRQTHHTAYGLWHPLSDVKLTPSEITVLVDLPGVDEDDIDVTIETGMLRIRGNRDFDHDKEDAEEYVRIDRIYGPYVLTVALPEDARASDVSAKYRRGVLKVRVPRGGGHP